MLDFSSKSPFMLKVPFKIVVKRTLNFHGDFNQLVTGTASHIVGGTVLLFVVSYTNSSPIPFYLELHLAIFDWHVFIWI